MKDVAPSIPLGQQFWPLTDEEKGDIASVFQDEEMRRLATVLRSRDDDADVKLVDAAYWLKGCSSLGRLRYAALLEVKDKRGNPPDYCLMDVKEAAKAAAPPAKGVTMPSDQGDRVVEGARHFRPSRQPHAGGEGAGKAGLRARADAAGSENRNRAAHSG